MANESRTTTPRRSWVKAAGAYLGIGALSAGIGYGIYRTLDGNLAYSGRMLFLAICGAFLLVALWFADHWKKSALTWALTVVLAALTFASVFVANGDALFEDRSDHGLHTWNNFHYVLATKYFNEVGYFDLYKAAYMADEEGKRMFREAKSMRDMYTYRVHPLDQMLTDSERERVRDAFTDKRWKSFKRDMNTIFRLRPSTSFWRPMILDRGFNPSPAWLAIHQPLLNAVDIHRMEGLVFWCHIGDLCLVAAAALMGWAFGLRVMLISTMWFCIHYGNQDRILGGYFSYDWLLCLVIAVVALVRGKRLIPGFVLSYAAMVRGFPGLAATQSALLWIRDVVRTKKLPKERTLFFLALVGGCALFVLLGALNSHGIHAWSQWAKKIEIHSENHVYGENRVGMKYLFAQDPKPGRWDTRHSQVHDRLEDREPWIKSATTLAVVLTLLAMLRRNEKDGMILFLPLVFWIMVLSRYYLSAAILMFALDDFDRRRIWNLLVGLGLFAVQIAFYVLIRIPNIQIQKPVYAANAVYTAVFAFIVLSYLAKDVMEWRAARPGDAPPDAAPPDSAQA